MFLKSGLIFILFLRGRERERGGGMHLRNPRTLWLLRKEGPDERFSREKKQPVIVITENEEEKKDMG